MGESSPETEAIQHGIRSTYVNLKCRCATCKKANCDYMRPYMNEWKHKRSPRGFPQKRNRKGNDDG
jgi:hypothetical protein